MDSSIEEVRNAVVENIAQNMAILFAEDSSQTKEYFARAESYLAQAEDANGKSFTRGDLSMILTGTHIMMWAAP